MDFPTETVWWATKRSVYGAEIKPTRLQIKPPSSQESKLSKSKRSVKFSDVERSSGESSSEKRDKFNVATVARLPSNFVSSLTDGGDSDDEDLPMTAAPPPEPAKKKMRFRSKRRNTLMEARNKSLKSLEVISELSASHFESITEDDGFVHEIEDFEDTEINSDEEDEINDDNTNVTPVQERISESGSEHRWSASLSSASSPSGHTLEDPDEERIQMLPIPKRISSGHMEIEGLDDDSSSNGTIDSSTEFSIQTPDRLTESGRSQSERAPRSIDPPLVPNRLSASERPSRSISAIDAAPMLPPRRKISE